MVMCLPVAHSDGGSAKKSAKKKGKGRRGVSELEGALLDFQVREVVQKTLADKGADKGSDESSDSGSDWVLEYDANKQRDHDADEWEEYRNILYEGNTVVIYGGESRKGKYRSDSSLVIERVWQI